MDQENSKKIDFLIKRVNELEEREKNYIKTENKLNERIKELNCLFELSNLISNNQMDLDDFLQSVVNIIPPAFQFSDVTFARISFGKKEFLTHKFTESKHVISSKFIVNDKLEGQIDVFSLKEKLTEDEFIFLHEEIKLIEEISLRLSSAINIKLFEERIKKSESMLILILSTIPQSIFWKDIHGVYLGCNSSFAKVAGFNNPLDIIGKTDYDLPWSKQESEAYRADDKYVVENIESKLHIIEKITTHDKKNLIIDTSKLPLVDDLGNVFGLLGVFEDVTNQKIMENALLESENKFKLAFMTSNDAIYIATIEDGILIEANNAFYDMFGYTQEEARGKSALDLNLYYDINDRTKMINELNLNGYVKNMELKGLKKSGDEIIVSISTSILNINDKKYILGVLRDITEDKKSELELIKAKEQAEENEKRIALLNLELENRVAERTAKLEIANKELESFSYSISHDLRAPLRAIDGFSKILIEKYASSLDKDAQSLVSRISGSSVKMSQLIDDILSFSRMNRYELKKSSIDMRLLVESTYNDITSEEEKVKISFILHHIPNSFGDEKVLRQVWVNLISNSIKFTSKINKPLIEVGFKVKNEKNIYFVRDNGVGFDMTYSDKLFNVFQRLHTESEYKGTGIGLAICKNIINKHGGNIWVESELNTGTTFYFYID